MPAREIRELRQAGKLDEAHAMAKAELLAEPENVWAKRNMSWVLYSQLDAAASNLPLFLSIIREVNQLALPETEEMFFDNISIVISKSARAITAVEPVDLNKISQLFDEIKFLPIKRNTKWFSVLFAAFHKGFKESPRYIEFADWWDFNNFQPENFQKETLPTGKEMMALAEQAYIAYAKNLLPQFSFKGVPTFDKQKAEAFIPKLQKLIDNYPNFQYPEYYIAKLLLALGDKENMLSALLPFAKKKRNNFWVWQILADAFSSDPEKVFACYCRALVCKSPEEMLVGLRQKMAKILISKQLYNEARTEIDLLVNVKIGQGFRIPQDVADWQTKHWYKTAVPSKNNFRLYEAYLSIAEDLLFSDLPEELVIVVFVNSDRKILNFIASETKFGFFKYERFLSEVKVGDILKVRFLGGSNEGMHQLKAAVKVSDDTFKQQFMKEVPGVVRLPPDRPFGFIDDVFIHPSLMTKYKLTDGMQFTGQAIKSYNQEKKQWGWKLL